METSEKRHSRIETDLNTIKALYEVMEQKDLYDGELMKKLYHMGFFDAPASTRFHGNYAGGLADHSITVAKSLSFLTKSDELEWQNPRSPFLIGLLHDLCKVDQYTIQLDGTISFNKGVDTRHGEKSVELAKQLVPDLTDEEELCIRWHMGSFDDKKNWTGYTDAIHKYRTVLYTHMADMLATHVYGI